ncbi:UDP-N-acetylmuramate dehydrogenase [Alteromonas sp. ASW11-19]|uniref:UDP-N-acetylenolpyruvoylglucosamine reductase n=1 Tax=Alteromonas salexigens TaxID=2982530 RepID=A0ABT2VK67_9ALTE|nr:UDP-N-acetylmuramate dehydrogenase [Alteromonas salexigens]MCU7553662.1 UDP-N-acetylmuramate dehydrogenase [Alteromonas salexigens]
MPSLQSYHTFGLTSSSQQLAVFSSPDECRRAYSRATRNWVLGGGSNTLFLDDYDGQVLINQITGITHHETSAGHRLRVGAGENWHELVTTCLQQGWHGMENLALIPGSVGASPIQNIGAYGVEVKSFIEQVEGVHLDTWQPFTLSREECQFGYRDSIFKHALAGKVLISYVTFLLPTPARAETSYGELARLNAPTPAAIYDEVIRVRRAKLPDPAELGNAGSFFKNPVISNAHFQTLKARYDAVPGFAVDESHTKVPAAWLIDRLGFKGKTHHGVRCHPTQPLVLTNLGHARGEDVTSLAKAIIVAVNETFNIQLEPEVRLVGREGLVHL